MTEDQFWDVHFLLGVKHDRDTVSIVPDFDEVLLGVNGDLDQAVREVRAILQAERLRRDRQIGLTDFVKRLRAGY